MKKSCLFQLVLFAVLVFVVAMLLRGYIEGCGAPREDTELVGAGLERDDGKGPISLQEGRRTDASSSRGIEGLSRLPVSSLMVDAPRVRGLAVNEGFFYVSSFDSDLHTASVYKINRDNHTVAQVRTLKEEGRYQSGGLCLRGDTLLVPLVGDEVDSSSSLLFLDTRHLEIRHKIEIDDRIRAVAQGTDGLIYGIGFDSSVFYAWTPEGEEVRRGENYNRGEYGDIEFMQGSLVCAGADDRSGVIDVIDPFSFSLLVRHRCYTRTPDQEWITGRGFAFFDGVFYFVPDEGHFPTLMKYVLDGVSPAEYIPSVGPET
ncbi:MAG: hypothetical protein ACLFV5_03795 [Anaerolineales bacterium]